MPDPDRAPDDEEPEESGGLAGLLGLGGDDTVELCRELARGIGGHEIVRLLGRGAEGSVFETRAPGGAPAALKVIQLDPLEPRRTAEIRARAAALVSLRHPGLAAPVAIVAESERRLAVAMELVEGEELDVHVAGAGDRRVARALECGANVARTLAYCESRGVVHGDVKPSNILVRPTGEAVLVDFGCARDPGSRAATRSFTLKGTLGYMAPELFLPGSAVDGRTDTFALGMALFRLVTGGLRTTGRGSELAAVETACARALAGERASPIDARRLAEALVRATELEPARRFASAGELAAELDAIREGRARARPASRRGRWFGVALAAALAALAPLLARARARGETLLAGDRLVAFACVPDPSTPSRLLVATYGRGVFRSEDGGATFAPSSRGLGDEETLCLAFDPHVPARVLLGTTFRGGVFESADAGATWRRLASFGSDVRALVASPRERGAWYVATANEGVFRSDDGGVSWSPASEGLTDRHLYPLVRDPDHPTTLFTGAERGGVFRTTDGGRTWQAKNAGIARTRILSLAFSPGPERFLLAGTDADGVYRSRDGGETWAPLSTALAGVGARTIVFDPRDASRLFVGGDRLLATEDGGATWARLDSEEEKLYVYSLLLWPPAAPRHLLVAGPGLRRWRLR